jgi:hypothetical protein
MKSPGSSAIVSMTPDVAHDLGLRAVLTKPFDAEYSWPSLNVSPARTRSDRRNALDPRPRAGARLTRENALPRRIAARTRNSRSRREVRLAVGPDADFVEHMIPGEVLSISRRCASSSSFEWTHTPSSSVACVGSARTKHGFRLIHPPRERGVRVDRVHLALTWRRRCPRANVTRALPTHGLFGSIRRALFARPIALPAGPSVTSSRLWRLEQRMLTFCCKNRDGYPS